MPSTTNPFSKIRAEQMGNSAWKYFVELDHEYIGAKPLIFEGSRGTGKTMFFKCHSWKEKLDESQSKGIDIQQFLVNNKHIGFYYKVDGRFVKSLNKKNIDNSTWIGIFNTYFNAVIVKEIIIFLELLLKNNLIKLELYNNTFKQISLMIDEEGITNFQDLLSKLDITLIKIEKFANNTEKDKPIGLNAGTIIEKLLLISKNNDCLKHTTFHIFVDEFEVLNEPQQIELNTLLKQSNNDIVYDFGVITKGIQSYLTSSGQTIQQKDDFTFHSTDSYYGYENKSEYQKLLKNICEKRLSEHFKLMSIDNNITKYTDISFYLKNYGRDYEEEQLFPSKPEELSKIKDRILKEIKINASIYNYSDDEIESYYTELTENVPPSILRMHLALLLRKGQPPEKLVEYKKLQSKKYKDWVHNTKTAVIYLLCHELGVKKTYHGFDVYSALSSGVVRSFLELVEFAFDYAFDNHENPFSFDNPREFTVNEQTKAVHFVSNFKVKEIDSYEPYGNKLREFTIALGRIFNGIQTNSDATLGEVEHNHFETKVNELKKYNPEAENLLKHAVRYKILEETDPTKTKSEEIVEFVDYHLNHIYCPAFGISHLRKRKIPISHLDLAKLFCGSHKELENVVIKLSGITEDKANNEYIQPTLFRGY